MPEIELSHGTLRYRDQGEGPVVVLIHGLMVNGTVWEPLAARLQGTTRCIVPDLPLGSHSLPMEPSADLSPRGLAALISELLERLDLDEVTLVGNDTGGALCQLVCAYHPDRLGRLVLTNCDAFEHFPPPAIRPAVTAMARVPGLVAVLDVLARSRAVRRRAMSLMPLTVSPVPDAMIESWVRPLHDRGVRRDLVRVARGISPDVMASAEPGLRAFERPALIAWGLRDKLFPLSDGERLCATLPRARLEQVPEARTFVQLDAPDRLAELIAAFIAEGPGAQPTP